MKNYSLKNKEYFAKLSIIVVLFALIIPFKTTLAWFLPGAEDNPSCLPSDSGCDVYPALISGDNISELTNDSSYITNADETDQVFTAWDKSTGISITESQISDLQSYLTAESDPVFIAWDKSTGISITESQISDLQSYLTAESDPVFIAWDKSTGISITESQISDLDHFTNTDETDQVFTAWDKSTGISITESQISDLDHFTNTDETDQVFTAWDKSTGISITESQISDLDHFTNTDETDQVFTAWDKSTGISITESQISDLQSYFKTDQTTPQTVSGGVPIFDDGWQSNKWYRNGLGTTLEVLTGRDTAFTALATSTTDGGALTSVRNNLNRGTATSTTILNTNAYRFWVGNSTPFNTIGMWITTVAVNINLVVEYWDGGAWTAVSGLSDGTSNLTAAGTITFTTPGDWATLDKGDGSGAVYWLKIRSTTSSAPDCQVNLVQPISYTANDLFQFKPNPLDTETTNGIWISTLGKVAIPRITGDVAIEGTLTAGGIQTGNATISGGAMQSTSVVSGATGLAANNPSTDNKWDTVGLQIYPGAATGITAALIPTKVAAPIRIISTAWDVDGAVNDNHNWFQTVIPYAGNTTHSRYVISYNTGTLSNQTSEFLNISETGDLTSLGTTLGDEVFTNGAFTSGTSWNVTGQFALTSDTAKFTAAAGALTGTLYQASTDYAVALKPYRWYKFTYTTSAINTTCRAYIGSEVLEEERLYLPGVMVAASAGTYSVYFKTNSSPGNFTIYADGAAASDSVTFDNVSLKEVTSGNIIASGKFTGGGTNGLTIDQTGVATFDSTVSATGLISPKWYPSADSTTALQINKADGTTNVFNVDTTNGRVGIGTTSPGVTLDVQIGSATNAARFANNDSTTSLPSVYAVAGFANYNTTNNTASIFSFQTKTLDGTLVAGARFGAQHTSHANGANTADFFIDTTNAGTNSEKLRLKADGALLLGSSTLRSVGGATRMFQIESTGTAPLASIAVIKNSNDAYGSVIDLAKTRGTAVGGTTIVNDGDNIGVLGFVPCNGANLNTRTASITAQIDGTPGASDLPTRLIFETTPDGSLTAAERMRITAAGYVGIGTATPGYPLDVSGVVKTNSAIISTGAPSPWPSTIGSYTAMYYYTTGDAGRLFAYTGAAYKDLAIGDWNSGNPNIMLKVGGNVGLGIGSPGYRLDVSANSASSYATRIFNDGNDDNRYGLLIQAGADTPSAGKWIQFNDGDAGDIGTISLVTGTLTLTTTSDERLKENIQDSNLSLENLLNIKVRDYSLISDQEHKMVHGFIAQELYESYPDAVLTSEDPDKYWQVSYSQLTPLIIKSIQDLNLKVEGIASLDLDNKLSLGSLIVRFFEEQIALIKEAKIGTLRVEEKVCVDDICITKEQFKQMLINNGGVSENQEESLENNIEVSSNSSQEETVEQTEEIVTETENTQETEEIQEVNNEVQEEIENPPVVEEEIEEAPTSEEVSSTGEIESEATTETNSETESSTGDSL